VTPEPDTLASRASAGFRYSDLLSTGADDSPYRLITTEAVSEVEGPDGQQFLKVAPED
jgi:fumarate hydratase class I